MLNKVCMCGRFTKDPELRSTTSGTSVVSFSLAVDRDYIENGERKADFINCVAYKGTAEFISKYFHRGSMAVVEGRIQTRSWDKPEGKGYATEVLANNIYFGESKKAEASNVAEMPMEAPDEGFVMGNNDDLPF